MSYCLDDEYNEFDGEQLWQEIMHFIPYNVVSFYENDLSSARLTPLLAKYITESESDIGKHIVAANLIRQRPREWIHWNTGKMGRWLR